jgi:hypothetical protein
VVDDEAAPIVQRIFDLHLAGWCRKAIAEQLTWSELEAYVDQLGDIGLALGRAEAEGWRQLYESLRLSLIYHHG